MDYFRSVLSRRRTLLRQHTPSAGGGGSDDKKSSSSTGSATVSVSGDEGGDTSSSFSRGGAGGEGSTDGVRHGEKGLVRIRFSYVSGVAAESFCRRFLVLVGHSLTLLCPFSSSFALSLCVWRVLIRACPT